MFGEKIRELREAKGFMQREVAQALQIDTAYLNKIEHNKKPVNKDHLKKLAKLLGVSEQEITSYWLAEKISKTLTGEKYGKQALNLVLKKIDKL